MRHLKKKPGTKRRERIIRNKDIEALGLRSENMQINMCKRTPDKRMKDWAMERREYGFDSRETWNFSQTLFEFLYTRIKMYDRVDIFDTECCIVTCSVYGDAKEEYHMSLQSFLNHVLEDLELVLVNFDEICFDSHAEQTYRDAGKRVLSALSECIFAMS